MGRAKPLDQLKSSDIQDLTHVPLLVGGEWTEGEGRLEVWNPAHPEQLVGTVARGTREHVERAVRAAHEAGADWSARSVFERAKILEEAIARLEERLDERSALYTRENGKTLGEARSELSGIGFRLRLILGFTGELARDEVLDTPHGRTFVTRHPFGVVASITPWNAPISLALPQIFSALLTGNTVVVKPPSSCPLTLIETIRQISDLFPPGALNVVAGPASEIGDALTSHPLVRKVAFTGSTESGREILRSVAGTVKSVTLELGGNDPAVVLPDVDLSPETMDSMAGAVFSTAGQICMAIKRIYVHERIHDAFVEAFTAAADRIVVGDGLSPGVTMGPLHTATGRDKVRALVEEAEAGGATVSTLGTRADPEVFEKGYFLMPQVLTDVPPDTGLVREEQFGPAVPVLRVRDEEEAVELANTGEYGLGASVWCGDPTRGLELARRLEAGTIFVNAHGVGSVNRKAPYGGVKQSGIGRKSGLEGLEEYVELRTTTTYE